MGALFFLIQECWLNVRRQGLMTLASVSTAAVSLTTLGLFVLIAWHVHAIAQAIPRQFEVHAFCRTDVPRQRAEELVQELRAFPGVIQVKLVPREVAWSEFQKRYERPDDLEGMTENPLPDKLEIQAASPEITLQLADHVRTLPEIDRVNEGKEVLHTLIRIANIIRISGLVLAALFALGTAAVVSNVIRITLYARRRDIRVMQLVGATNSFIRLPFVLEGVLAGAVGGSLACGVMAAAMYYVNIRVLANLPFVNELHSSLNLPSLCASLILGGALLGMFGSLFSLRRFLRVA